jgi:hypothetical protein
MFKRTFYLSSTTCLLLETGDLIGAESETGEAPHGAMVLLSRALCRFHFLPKPPGLTKREAEGAAFLHAEAHAPFVTSHSAIFSGPSGHAIWWWDGARIRDLMGEGAPYRHDLVAPESVAHGSGDAWRHVRTADGFEAQYREGATLRASRWRDLCRMPDNAGAYNSAAGTISDVAAQRGMVAHASDNGRCMGACGTGGLDCHCRCLGRVTLRRWSRRTISHARRSPSRRSGARGGQCVQTLPRRRPGACRRGQRAGS